MFGFRNILIVKIEIFTIYKFYCFIESLRGPISYVEKLRKSVSTIPPDEV
jgi:hypothetical protein